MCVNLLETDGKKDAVDVILQRNAVNKTIEKDAKYLSLVKAAGKEDGNRAAGKTI